MRPVQSRAVAEPGQSSARTARDARAGAAPGPSVPPDSTPGAIDDGLVGEACPSPAGPAEPGRAFLREPPRIPLPRSVQVLHVSQRQIEFMFRWRRRLGDVFRSDGIISGRPVITCHPDHVKSLFTAPPELVPTLAAESPLRPVLGPGSVLTANGSPHLRQRKLLLPPFHGESIEAYVNMIRDVVQREIDTWPVCRPFSLAPRMQAITLDVIMGGIFGIAGRPRRGTLEYALRSAIRELLRASTMPGAKLAELMNLGHKEPFGLTWLGLRVPDRLVYALISKRRRDLDLEQRSDILSMLMRARSETGEELGDRELRDELMTLVLAGHETTANQLAWTWERLLRTPRDYERLRDAVRSDEQISSHIEAAITEGMRTRPVIPAIGRRVTVPWRLGEYGIPGGTPVVASIVLLHHREDLYPDPFAYRLERWLSHKPGTYEWIPFGGGTRRCLGAALAMAEQRVVLEAMIRRLDLAVDDPDPEHAKHRNVTMIPGRGGRVVIRAKATKVGLAAR